MRFLTPGNEFVRDTERSRTHHRPELETCSKPRSDPHLGRFDQNIKLPDGGAPNLYRAEYAFRPDGKFVR